MSRSVLIWAAAVLFAAWYVTTRVAEFYLVVTQR